MTTDPYLQLLDRVGPAAEVLQHFQPQIDTLADMVNYGTMLIRRSYGSSEKTTVDVIVLGVLLKQVVSMLDAMEVLLRAGVVHAAFLQSRAALEASLYLRWILLSDAETKARCYVVANLRHERMWALRSMRGTPEAAAFDRVANELDLDIHAVRPTIEEEAAKHIEHIDRNLALESLTDIDKKFDAARGKRPHDPDWYKVAAGDDRLTLRGIADQVNRLPQYEFYYSKGSHVTHAALYRPHVQFRGDEVRFLAIRSLRDLYELLQASMQTALDAYMLVLRRYRQDEVQNFARYYLENWRGAFTSIPEVAIKE